MSKNILPNTVLPSGGHLIRPIKRKIGHWVEMVFDAEVTMHGGMRWLRVRGGFGQRGDREDWVADFPANISVSDCEWREPRWGPRHYNSFEEATLSEMKIALVELQKEAKEAAQRSLNLQRAVDSLKDHLKGV